MQNNSFNEDELKSEDGMINLPQRRVYFYPVCNGNPMENAFSFTADYIEVGPKNILIYAECGNNKYRITTVIDTDKIVGYSF